MVATAVAVLLIYSAGIASAGLIESVIKIGGVGFLVSKYGDEIDKAFNKLVKIEQSDTVATKVLPVISVGKGTSIGAVQVTGSPEQVAKTQAVLQIEGKILGIRIRALIPNDSKNVTKINRVEGVGVSGIVDIKV
jgi:hypothetical protein